MAVIGHFDSLSEAIKLTNNILLEGIVDEVYKDGGIWPMLPIMQLDGLNYTYLREVEPSAGDFIAIGEEIGSDADQTFTSVEASLKRYVKQYDLDQFIRDNYRNVNDAEVIALNAVRKGVQLGLEDNLIYGDDSVDTDGFDGLHAMVAANSGQVISEGSSSTGAALNLHNLFVLVDLVRPRPDYLIMNRNIQRRLSEIALSGTTSFPVQFSMVDLPSGMGRRMLTWDGIPIIVSDFITQTETISSGTYASKTGGATTSIFACRFGDIPSGGVCMLHGSKILDLVRIDNLEDKDATRYRLMTYAAPALGSTKALAVIDGITDVAVAA